jgi:hypothetical protein
VQRQGGDRIEISKARGCHCQCRLLWSNCFLCSPNTRETQPLLDHLPCPHFQSASVVRRHVIYGSLCPAARNGLRVTTRLPMFLGLNTKTLARNLAHQWSQNCEAQQEMQDGASLQGALSGSMCSDFRHKTTE